MNKIISYKIKYCGTSINNFLNTLIKNNISIFNIVKENNSLMFSIAPNEYKKFKTLISIDKYSIEKMGGIKFLISQIVKKIGVVIGVLAILISNILLSKKLLYIKIIGTTSYADAIKTVLNENNIKIGKSNKINCDVLEDKIINNVYGLSLVSAKISGNALIVSVVEKEHSIKEFQPFYAPFNMVIKDIKLISGTLNVGVDSVVKKGDILVEPYIINASGERLSVSASANIVADVWFCGSEDAYKEKINYSKTGNKYVKKHISVNRCKNINIVSPYITFVTETTIENVSCSMFLPIYLHKTIIYETIKCVENFDLNKNKDLYFEKSKQKAYEILPSNVIINEEIQRLSNTDDKYIFQTYLRATMEISNEN